MIKEFVLFQEMPELSDTLYHEMDTVWGAPLSFTMSWVAQRLRVRIMSLLCPPTQPPAPTRIQWHTGYSHTSQNSRKGILKRDSQVKMIFFILDFYGVEGKIHGYVATSSEVIFSNDYWNQNLDFEAKQSKDNFCKVAGLLWVCFAPQSCRRRRPELQAK